MVFKSLLGGWNRSSVYLGAPEAEGDATPNSRVPLLDVYEDYHGLIPQLTHEKFIVVGRKGSGKSAFAEYVWLKAQDEPNLFCHFIRKNDFSLEKIVQIGNSEGFEVDSEALFKWIIYTNILKLFAFNEAVSSNKDYELLRQFIKKNSGYVDIREYEIRELIKKHGFEVNIEQFKRFMLRGKFNKQIKERSSRAPFYKLLPHLEEVIVKVLSSEEEKRNQNSYVLFFDDLDIGFFISDQLSCDSLVRLIRTCRHVNNDIFGKKGIRAKAVVLIRDDIEHFLSSRYADTAKIFSSYSAKINWYQNNYTSNYGENDLNIKKLINKRIAYAFKSAMLKYDDEDPWSSLVTDKPNGKSTFKYLLNNTLFRPRDLLLLFKPLENGAYSYPLSKDEVNALVNNYAEELAKELKNELSSFYSSDHIEMIFNALGELAREYKSYDDAKQLFSDHCGDIEPENLMEYLFDRSVLGNVDDRGWFTFKCREPISSPEPYRLRTDRNIAIQYGIRTYVLRKGYANCLYADQR